MAQEKHALWTRILLALLALVIFAFSLPAYPNPSANPALARLSPENASLGSVAGAFLGRQVGLALIAIYGAIRGTTQPMLIGAFAMGFFNLHDAVLLSTFGSGGPGAIAGLILGAGAIIVMVAVGRKRAQQNA